MSEAYKVWVPGYGDSEEDARPLEGYSASNAAERFVEEHFGELDYPREVDVAVICVRTGEFSEWTVDVESRPVFSATRIKRPGEASP